MHRNPLLLLCLGLTTLCACANLKVQPPQAGGAGYSGDAMTTAPDVEKVLAYFDALRALPPEEMEKEYARLEKYEDALTRLRRALLLSLPASGIEDTEEALTLLDSYLAQVPADNSMRAFALLLVDFVAERREYEDRLQVSEKRIETLQRQLEALKSIENSINRRGQEEAKKP